MTFEGATCVRCYGRIKDCTRSNVNDRAKKLNADEVGFFSPFHDDKSWLKFFFFFFFSDAVTRLHFESKKTLFASDIIYMGMKGIGSGLCLKKIGILLSIK